MGIILFLIVIAVLVFVHELGHFIFAKRAGIRVDEFAIGFPPRIFSYRKGETVYTINLIPFGGFVKIFGENPDDPELSKNSSLERAFLNQKKTTQALVLVAGVLFNIIFAWLVFSAAITLGISAPADYKPVFSDLKKEVIVTGVAPESPAQLNGLLAGDVIIEGQAKTKISGKFSADDFRNFINLSGGEQIKITVDRGGERKDFLLEAKDGIVDGRAVIGVALSEIGLLQAPFHIAFFESAKLTLYMTYSVALGFFVFIGQAIIGAADFSQIAGPVGIVGLVGEASSIGFAYFLSFLAFISINLAVLNLLPFPALDGGRLLFLGIEALMGRRINGKVAGAANAIGFALLILLMIVVTINDLGRLF